MYYRARLFVPLLVLCSCCMACRVMSQAQRNPTAFACSYARLLLVSSNTVVVSSGRVTDQGEEDHDNNRVSAFRAKDGVPLWGVEVESSAYRGIGGGDATVIIATRQKLHCLRLSDGSSVWTAELAKLTSTRDPDMDPDNPLRRAGLPPSPLRKWCVNVSRLMLVDHDVVVWLTMTEEMADVSRLVAESWVVLRETDGHELLRGGGRALAATSKLFYVAEWRNGRYELSTVAGLSEPKPHQEVLTTLSNASIIPLDVETVDVVEGALRWPAVIRTRNQSYLVGSDDKRLIEVAMHRVWQKTPGWVKYMAANDGLVVYRYAAGSTESGAGRPVFDVEFAPFDGSEGWRVTNPNAGLHAFTGEHWDVIPLGFDGSRLLWCLGWNWSEGEESSADAASLVAVSKTDGSVLRVIPITGTVAVYGGAMLSPETNAAILIRYGSVKSAQTLEPPCKIVSVPISATGLSWEHVLVH